MTLCNTFLERDNPRLKGALNKNYGRADLDKHRLGELIDLIGSIQLADVASRVGGLLVAVHRPDVKMFVAFLTYAHRTLAQVQGPRPIGLECAGRG